jgi:hypothetical protein
MVCHPLLNVRSSGRLAAPNDQVPELGTKRETQQDVLKGPSELPSS